MSEVDSYSRLDRFDLAILDILAENGRMPVTELAAKVGLSTSPCQVRLRKLIEGAYISGFRAVLNPVLLRREHVAFTEVKLADTTEPALDAFNRAVATIPEIEQCHMIAGSFDYLLKVRTEDIQAYRRILGETISALPYVANTSTHVAMQSVKESSF